ncbi:MAG: phage antirepressor [Selenomonadaceae bacterium]|nr:phage antirepressor [Selenomonadaceae bacterium]
MENQVQLFNHSEFGGVRVVNKNEPWFVGKDVAEALGYSNPQKALRDHVSDKFKRTERIVHPLGGTQDTILINEAGMYKLVMRSKLPSAEKFSDWVCEEVLPSIRKTGMYATPAKVEEIIRNPDAFIETLIQGYQRVKGERDAALNQVAELKPKADYCEKILQSPETLCVTVIAKDYGYSGVMFNQLLGSFKIQRRVGKVWVLYQDYLGKGYVETETVVTKNGGSATQMKWTQKGRMFLYDFLKARGILPLCEKTMPDLFGGVA